MVRLIATDLDGTLLEEGSTCLNPEYFRLIDELAEQGITFAVATGRPEVSVRKTFAPVIDKIWVISLNGSMISRNGVHRILKPTPTEWVRELWKDMSEFSQDGVESIVDTADKTICPFADTDMYRWVRDEYKYNIQATGSWDNVPEDSYIMMTLYHPESTEKFLQEHHWVEKWADRMSVVVTGDNWADWLMPGINKGAGLRAVCEELQINPADTLAFGDGMNDIPLIQAAGIGCAVDNARQEVQDAADRVVPGYASDGVLAEIRRQCGLR